MGSTVEAFSLRVVLLLVSNQVSPLPPPSFFVFWILLWKTSNTSVFHLMHQEVGRARDSGATGVAGFKKLCCQLVWMVSRRCLFWPHHFYVQSNGRNLSIIRSQNPLYQVIRSHFFTKNVEVTIISGWNSKFSVANTTLCFALVFFPPCLAQLIKWQDYSVEACANVCISLFKVLNLLCCAKRRVSSFCGVLFRLQF